MTPDAADYLHLIPKVAAYMVRKYKVKYLMPEAESAANLGLLRAVRKWHPSGGAAFKTFATTKMKYAVLECFRSELARRGVKAVPGQPPPKVGRLSPATPVPQTTTDSDFEAHCRRLPPVQSRVVVALYVEDQTVTEIAEELNLSTTRVYQLLRAAHGKVKQHLLRNRKDL